MSNTFTKPSDLIAGTTARAEDINNRVDATETGFDNVEVITNRTIKLPVGTAGDQLISESAANRALKEVGFDASGNLVLISAAFQWKGDWATSTAYIKNDVVRDSGTKNIYTVQSDHTSGVLATDISAAKLSLAINVADVETAKTAAQTAQTAAETAQTAAELAETNAETAETNVTADLVLTNADVVLTHADVVLTHADVVLTVADVVSTHADVVLTHADVVLAEADKVQTGLDKAATNADVILTHADVVLAEADKVQTGLDKVATNADVVLTHADVVLAEADKVQTGLDRTAVANDKAASTADVAATNADVVLTHADVVLTNADVVSAEADKVQTGLDRVATAADVVLTAADVVSAEADKVQTGLDRVATAADVVLTAADVVSAEADKVQTALDRIATAADKVATNADASSTSTSATNAANSAASAAASLDNFDDRYLGAKSSAPTVDNDGNALVEGAMYFDSSANGMKVYDGADWIAASAAGTASMLTYKYTATSGQTTFTGADANSLSLTYTVANIIVMLNGITLDAADFTATSGTSVVLGTGATTGDELVVVAFKSFTVADHYTQAQADALLGAKAPLASPVFTGPTTVNRLSTDGTIVDLQKDGTTVGSVGIESGGFYIDGEADHAGLRFGGSAIGPRDGGAEDDGNINLGNSTNRFKDLYLGGGVYLGGTGSANKLDDYEEGTFTATLTSATGSITTNTSNNKLSYTKIGRAVFISGTISVSSVSSPSGDLNLTGLPFSNASGDEQSERASFNLQFLNLATSISGNLSTYMTASSTSFRIRDNGDTTSGGGGAMGNHIKASTFLRVSGHYFV